MRLAGCLITARAPKISGSALVASQDMVPPLLERLLAAYAALDEGGRLEVIRHAEQLAGTTP